MVRVTGERNCRKVVREGGGGKCLCNCGEVEREKEFWKSKVEEMEKVYELEVKSVKESIMSECRMILVIIIEIFVCLDSIFLFITHYLVDSMSFLKITSKLLNRKGN